VTAQDVRVQALGGVEEFLACGHVGISLTQIMERQAVVSLHLVLGEKLSTYTGCPSFAEEKVSACHSERSEESPHLYAQPVRKMVVSEKCVDDKAPLLYGGQLTLHPSALYLCDARRTGIAV
jgi:hypothetical protein